MTNPLYSDEAIIRSVTYSTKGGHKVSFEMDPVGWEVFKGMETTRCMMVLVPIQNDGQPDPEAAQRASTPAPERKREAWDECSPTKQAHIRCNDVDFQAWTGCFSADEAAIVVRARCKIKSRAELGSSGVAAARWHQMDADFLERNIG